MLTESAVYARVQYISEASAKEKYTLKNKLFTKPCMSSNVVARKILIFAANPKSTSRLRLDEEVREIDEGLCLAKQRDRFELVQRWAVRPRDIHRAMLETNPHIVHFAGHGAGEEGLVFEDETGQPKFVTNEALAGLFGLFADQVECVVLNGCYSVVQAETIAQHIPYVIGMRQAIGDRAAIAFAVGFYDALGAGRLLEFAYKVGCNAIQMEGIPEHLTPILVQRMTWELAKNLALYADEELKMIDLETGQEIRGLDIEGVIYNDDSHYIKLGQSYRLQITFPYIGKNLLLINEDGKGKKLLLCPSKAFAEVPQTLISKILHLPPDDRKPGRAKSLRFLTEGEEYFLVIVTAEPIELSWVRESPAREIELNEVRLEEIFIKVGQQSNFQVFYKRFIVSQEL